MAVKAGDQISIVDVTDSCSVNLTADSFTIAGNASGVPAAGGTLTTTVQAFRGDEALTASDVTVGTITGITGATATASGLTITITYTTSLTGGQLTIPISIGDLEYEKKVSLAIAKTGGTGAGAYSYVLTASPDSAVKAVNGTITPTKITFSATRAQGTGNPAAYQGRFKIEYTANGTDWTAGYTSSGNEASKEYTIPSTAIVVRCTLYAAGGTTTTLAIKSVPIVPTGATGKSVSSITGHYLATDASSGVTTSTSGWSTGIQSMTSTNKYLWYYETISFINPTSSSNTTPVIIGTYGDKGDKGDQGIPGVQGNPGEDAITLAVTSSAGTIFKNAAIATTLTAHVYKGGKELSSSTTPTLASQGTIKWYKDGGTTAVATGQTLTISAGQVQNKVTYIAQLEA